MVQFGAARAPDRFWSKCTPEPTSGCWLWTAKTAPNGYGQFYMTDLRRQIQAHRAAYELLVGPIPDGLDLDHLCRVRCCVNPAHLEPVTRSENLLRGIGPDLNRARMAAIATCPQGHRYDEENTHHRPDRPGRGCFVCRRARTAIANAQRKQRGA